MPKLSAAGDNVKVAAEARPGIRRRRQAKNERRSRGLLARGIRLPSKLLRLSGTAWGNLDTGYPREIANDSGPARGKFL